MWQFEWHRYAELLPTCPNPLHPRTTLAPSPRHHPKRRQPRGTFALTIGEGFEYREQAQDLTSDLGKIVRLNEDGTVPRDNPFVGRPSVRPEIYTWGHRNEQGLIFDAQSGRLYETEHGPRGGDELNIIVAGRNYGWPVITYGMDYSGAYVSPYTQRPGLEQPVIH